VAFFESLQQVVTVAKRVAHTKEFNKQIFTKNMKYQKIIDHMMGYLNLSYFNIFKFSFYRDR